MIATVNTNGQDIGNAQLKIFYVNGKHQTLEDRDLLSRNWTFESSIRQAKPVSIRFFMTDAEVESLSHSDSYNASKMNSAYDFDVIHYSGPKQTIYDQLSDNISSVPNGTYDRTEIDLSGPQFRPGLYFLKISSGGHMQTVKLIKL